MLEDFSNLFDTESQWVTFRNKIFTNSQCWHSQHTHTHVHRHAHTRTRSDFHTCVNAVQPVCLWLTWLIQDMWGWGERSGSPAITWVESTHCTTTGVYKCSILPGRSHESQQSLGGSRRNRASISSESAPWGTVVRAATFSARGRTPMSGSACRPSALSGRLRWSFFSGFSSATTRSQAAAGQSFEGPTTSPATSRMTSTSDIPVSTKEEPLPRESFYYFLFYD